MKKIAMNLNWERSIGASREHWLGDNNPKEIVNLPDDFILNQERSADAPGGASTGYFPGGRAVYKKNFDVPEEWSGKQVILDIDGAYMNAGVTLNNETFGVHPYGYTPWQIDLNRAIIPGEINELEIVTRCIQPNSRWYSGGGLYREVNLWVGEACHIRPWDLFVTTPEASENEAFVRIFATLSNISDIEANGTVTAKIEGVTVDGSFSIASNDSSLVELEIKLINPKLWSADIPNLYELEVIVESNLGIDVTTKTIGIRQIEIDAKQGMRVNGVPVKLLGGCIHHDNTLLGSAAFPRAEERKIELLKKAGYNAIRCAHNPPSATLLDACDRLGMYVINESFDCWRIGKNDQDYHLYFDDWWQRDTAAMVLRDRNHPSVFCWSIGNELEELGGMNEGVRLTKMQADYVRSLDPTRPVTAGVHSMIKSKREKGKPAIVPFRAAQRSKSSEEESKARMQEMMTNPAAFDIAIEGIQTNNMGDGMLDGDDVWGELSKDALNELDVVGYNYLSKRYEIDREKYPNRVIIGSETHATTTYDYYQAMMENPNVIGDFIWTAYDNLGEAGAGRVIRDVGDMMSGMLGLFPWLSCYQGDLDLDGNRRPQSYYRKVMWGKDKGIHLFVKPPQFTGRRSSGLGWQWSDVWKSWTWAEEYIGKDIDLEVYADCDEVEFVLNGESFGRSKVNCLIANFTLPYQPGTLKAVAWKNGEVIAEDVLVTAGKPVTIELIPDRNSIASDGMDLSFVTVRLLDESGIVVPVDDIELSAEVVGGTLAGFGSGNPCTDENYGTGMRKVWKGQALICLRADGNSGTEKLTLKVSTSELSTTTTEIKYHTIDC